MLERLGEALEHERAFVADASHELRTPLAILRTELELRPGRRPFRQELRDAIASAAEETDRLTQLSEDLLTIAQTERGELPLKLSTVELIEILEGVAGRFSRRAETAGREIALDGERTEIVADRLRLDQAIGSMVDNALRYGSGQVTLGCSSQRERGRGPRLRPGRGVPREVPRQSVRALQSAPRRAGATGGAASGWRSCRRSPMLTVARPTPPTPMGAPTSGLPCPSVPRAALTELLGAGRFVSSWSNLARQPSLPKPRKGK